MADASIEKVLSVFKLNDKQRAAALERGRDVVVTAGAGSGKTSTLAARYTSLLAGGTQPRRIAAITFTKKAAREMRSRVRAKLMELQQMEQPEDERGRWVELAAQMDSARIGTIHSLCTEILRAHPAEAGVDPRFEVLDESLSAAFRIQAVDDTLKSLVEDSQFLPLLMGISPDSLTALLQQLLGRRLDAAEAFETAADPRACLAAELKKRMDAPALGGLVAELRGLSEAELEGDAGGALAAMVRELLALWSAAEQALAAGDPAAGALALYQARREKMNLQIGKKTGTVKQTLRDIQAAYDALLNPLIGGKGTKDPTPSAEAEALYEQLLPLLREAFTRAHQAYQALLAGRQSLDFDDLEYGAQQLLRRPEIRARWQAELDAVLVDEFQDTNQRQREIVEALAGTGGRLFIVGDMRQSIYRFRRADVTVFSSVQRRILAGGGLLVDLDLTYRSHEPLLQAVGGLLAEVMGTQADSARQYYVPYSPLAANEKNPPQHIRPPHVEFVFGVGTDSETARPAAARALALRLLQLKKERQIERWDDVALLFRSANSFPFYEQALEEAGIPFVTVAGRGFYDRPEIRDLVNILRALADPLDDLAVAGLLRSPAFGLSDAALFLLRQPGQSYWAALQGELAALPESDRGRAERARRILSSLLPQVDRVPVAELLKQAADAVDYRAVLATADINDGGREASAAGGRLWRNLDKLLEDAQTSKQVNVRDFLDMLQTLNDAGAREGEAPAEAEGALRLMSIHKSKGLEFNLVVLADACRRVRGASEQGYLSNELGVTFKLDPLPMAYKLARHLDKDQDEAEALRVLYVALTRAKHKLIISGHAVSGESGEGKLDGWAEDLAEAAGLEMDKLLESEGEAVEITAPSGQPMRAWCLWAEAAAEAESEPAAAPGPAPASQLPPLYRPILPAPPAEETQPSQARVWRAAAGDESLPGEVLGRIVHKALQRWLFPGDPRLPALLEAEALRAGLASPSRRENAACQALELLERLRRHPLWQEIDSARERHHELPYTVQIDGKAQNRWIDLLYLSPDGWRIVDFKTDPIRSDAQREELLRAYLPQVRRYRGAVKDLLGADARAHLCFLDDHGRVEVVEG